MTIGWHRFSLGIALAVAAAALAGTGCGHTHTPAPAAPQDRHLAPAVYPALRGTIGEMAALANSMPLRVEGYGIVADLPNTGSGEMPPPVRQILTEELYKRHAGSPTFGTENISPERILSGKQIAAVSVVGFVPSLAPKGTTFDLYLAALPGTQTTSLEYGLLWTTDLKIIGLSEGSMDTRILARGRGPVFCNPFAKKVDASGAPLHRNVRTGRVMSGGIVLEDLPATLQLYTPSMRIANQIQRTINARYASLPPCAAAQNEAVVNLTIPPGFHDNPHEFIDVIAHMYLAQDVPGFAERKCAELLHALEDPDAPHDDISMALEALGRPILPALQNAYTGNNVTARYYAARAGAGLGDAAALVVLEAFGRNDQSPYQYDAVSAIARHGDNLRANTLLENLLSSPNLRVRTAAYEGLVHINSPQLNSFRVGRKFIVDRVSAEGPPIIYATQTGLPRIALIGKKFVLPAGALYVSADNILTVNLPEAEADAPATDPAAPADPAKLYYRGPLGNQQVLLKSSPNLAVIIAKLGFTPDPRAADYNSKQVFIGVSYQRVLEMLAQLCKDHTIDATFVMQQPAHDDLALAAQAQAPRPDVNPAATAPAGSPGKP